MIVGSHRPFAVLILAWATCLYGRFQPLCLSSTQEPRGYDREFLDKILNRLVSTLNSLRTSLPYVSLALSHDQAGKVD